jgi:hypothetical protein
MLFEKNLARRLLKVSACAFIFAMLGADARAQKSAA